MNFPVATLPQMKAFDLPRTDEGLAFAMVKARKAACELAIRKAAVMPLSTTSLMQMPAVAGWEQGQESLRAVTWPGGV